MVYTYKRQNKNYVNKDLIKRFLNDECSAEEIEMIRHWANNDKDKARFFSFLEERWKEDDVKKEPDFVYENLWRKINQRVSEKETGTVAQPAVIHRAIDYFYYAKVAATIAIFMIVTTFLARDFYNYLQKGDVPVVTYITKSTLKGQKLRTRLPDGSVVILNSSSSIQYPDHFPEGKREVFLSGEAFFDVARDTSSPFKVHNGNVTTTALGTSFNIRATHQAVKVALTTGKVSVEAEGIPSREKIYLYPGEMAVYNPEFKDIYKERFDVGQVTGWKEGSIHFNHMPFSKIIEDLEQWYGVTISLEDNIPGSKKLTGEFNNESLESILQGLCFSLGYEFNIDEENVKIKIK